MADTVWLKTRQGHWRRDLCRPEGYRGSLGDKRQEIILLALDWAKAFDSISPMGLKVALKRFGCGDHFVEMISGIHTDRQFVVEDGGCTSAWHQQSFGIPQG